MPKRTRILVVDSNLDTLSRIYLSLIHKDYKVEATNDVREIADRIARFKPKLVILHTGTKDVSEEVYRSLSEKRIPVLLIQADGMVVPGWKRAEVIPMPQDLSFFDVKIKEILNLIE